MTSDTIPLLNEYKQEFFWKRLPQTLLGGAKLRLEQAAPCYIYFNQLILLLLPLVLGGIFTALVEVDALRFDIAAYIYGGLMIIFVIIVQVVALLAQKKRKCAVAPLGDRRMLAEEDELDFTSCCGSETIHFVIPPKKYKINIVFHALLSGIASGLGFLLLLPSTVGNFFDQNLAAKILLYIFGWISIALSQYSLTVAPAPETFVFRTSDRYEITPLSRPFYVILLSCFYVLSRYFPDFISLYQAVYVIFALLPVLWTCGVLPPVDAFLLWQMELGVVLFLGGSPMASNLRLLIMVTVSVGAFVAVYFIPLGLQTTIIISVAGYLLSIDLSSLAVKLLGLCCKSLQKSPDEMELNTGMFLWQWGMKEAMFHAVMVIITGGVAAVVNHFVIIDSTSNVDISEYVGYAVIGMLVVDWLLAEVQRVYVGGGLWRNKFYPSSVQRSAVFKKAKRKLRIVGYIRRVLTSFVAPLCMVIYFASSVEFTESYLSSLSVHRALSILGAVRAYRWIWQNTSSCLIEVSIVHILLVALPATNTTWRLLGVPTQHLLVGIACNRFAQLCGKLYTFFVILVKSWTDKKQRRKSTPLLMAYNIFIFPIAFTVICATAILGAPLLPLFTLPLFLIGFPRPMRFWAETVGGSANTCSDTMYYRQATPQLARALREGFASGSAGDCSPGSHLLLRFQDRLAWIHVLERGYAYCSISVKGLELQETSCHAVEATTVDDILESTFEHESGVPCCGCNRYPLNIMRPYDAAYVETYSDAKNQLTGLIDSPDILKSISMGFVKTLIWVIMHYLSEVKDYDEEKNDQSHLDRPKSARDAVSVKPIEKEKVGMNKNYNNNTKGSESATDNPPDKSVPNSPSIKSFNDSVWGSDDDSLFGESATRDIGASPKQETLKPASERNVSSSVADDRKRSAVPKRSPQKTPVSSAQPPTNEEDSDVDALFKDLEFALPAKDFSVKPPSDPLFGVLGKNKVAPISGKTHDQFKNVDITNFSVQASRKLALPPKWNQVPINDQKLRSSMSQFPEDWYKHVVSLCKFEENNHENGPHDIASEVAEDSELKKMYTNLVMACHLIVNDLGMSGGSPTPKDVHKVFTGRIPWSPALDWLSEQPKLQALVIKAYRYAVKLALDEAVLGEVTAPEELAEYLEDYSANWYMGEEGDPGWSQAVAAGRPQLFSLTHDAAQGTFHSRVLTLQDMPVFISSLNAECVRAQWANLSLELLYLTNDDEERYSIQAHSAILRNLTVQAADPPLGYPIYASQPLAVPTI